MFTRSEKIILFCLAAIQFNHILDFMIIMPLGPKLMRLFEINPDQFSLLVSIYTLMAGLSGLIASFFVDHFDRRKYLITMFTGFIISTALCGLSTSFTFLVISRALAGFFGGIMNSLIMSIVSDLINYERRASAMGGITSAFSLASILGVPLSLYLSNYFNWHAPFLFLAVCSIIIILIAAKNIPPIRGHLDQAKNTTTQSENPLLHIFKNRDQRNSLIFMFILMLGHFCIIPFISPSLVANAGVTENNLPLIYLTGGFCSMLMAPFIGFLSDRYGKTKVFTLSLVISTIPVYLITHQEVAPLYIVLPIAGLFFISAVARMIPANALVTAAADPAHRGSFLSILSCVQSLSMALGSWGAGQIVKRNFETGHLDHYSTVGYIAIFIGFIALLFFQKIKYLDHDNRRTTTT